MRKLGEREDIIFIRVLHQGEDAVPTVYMRFLRAQAIGTYMLQWQMPLDA